jgi:hypothetical protein
LREAAEIKAHRDITGDVTVADVTVALIGLAGWVESKAAQRFMVDEDWVQQLAKVAGCAQCLISLLHDSDSILIHKWAPFTSGVNILERLVAMLAQVRGGIAQSHAAVASAQCLTEAIDTYAAMISQNSEALVFPNFCGCVLEQAQTVYLEWTGPLPDSGKEEREAALANFRALIGVTAGSSSRHELPADTSVLTSEALTAGDTEMLLARETREVGADLREAIEVAP